MTLEETRARMALVKRRRRRATAVCLCLAAAAAACGIWAASRVMPLYGRWQYENRRESHALVSLDRPAYLTATIMYEHDPPSGILLEDPETGRRLRDIGIADDADARTMTITCDVGPDSLPGDFIISLVPADNYELKYTVDVQPSYKYMDGEILFASDVDGSMWTRIEASYGRCTDERGLRVMVHLTGRSYAPLVYDGFIAQPEDGDPAPVEINLSEAILWRGHDLSKATGVEVVVSGEYWTPDGSEIKQVNLKRTVLLREWPLYDPGLEGFLFDMSDTEDYLSGLNLKPPEGRAPEPDAEGEQP